MVRVQKGGTGIKGEMLGWMSLGDVRCPEERAWAPLEPGDDVVVERRLHAGHRALQGAEGRPQGVRRPIGGVSRGVSGPVAGYGHITSALSPPSPRDRGRVVQGTWSLAGRRIAIARETGCVVGARV